MFDIKVTGIDEVTTRLEKYNDLAAKAKELMNRIGEIGVDTASALFEVAEYDGTNDVVVPEPEWKGDLLYVHADGKSVYFIEFGSGVHSGQTHPLAHQAGAVSHGNYGYRQGRKQGWVYPAYKGEGTNGRLLPGGKKIFTHGNPPAYAMYNADKAMRANILDIAREVFK